MSNLKFEFGLRRTFFTKTVEQNCADPKCRTMLSHGTDVFEDVSGSVYCDSCGKCIRYSRKRQAGRSPEREALIRSAGLEE